MVAPLIHNSEAGAYNRLAWWLRMKSLKLYCYWKNQLVAKHSTFGSPILNCILFRSKNAIMTYAGN